MKYFSEINFDSLFAVKISCIHEGTFYKIKTHLESMPVESIALNDLNTYPDTFDEEAEDGSIWYLTEDRFYIISN